MTVIMTVSSSVHGDSVWTPEGCRFKSLHGPGKGCGLVAGGVAVDLLGTAEVPVGKAADPQTAPWVLYSSFPLDGLHAVATFHCGRCCVTITVGLH